MSAHDYLWPARPEYLRPRSTVVQARGMMEGVIGTVEEATQHGAALRWDTGGRARLGRNALGVLVGIDLRDVTARAHAAMAWTVVTDDLPLVLVRVTGDDRDHGYDDDDARRIIETLYRMRMMDETVTVAGAREALGWAERVAGVAS